MQGFCWGSVTHAEAQATANPAFILCPPSDAQVHGCLGAATALRKQLSQCIKFCMTLSSRLREDLAPHVCSASTRCKHENLTSKLRCCPQRHDASCMCLHHFRSDVWACRRYSSSPTADPSQVQVLTSVLTLAMQSQVLQAS